MGKTITAGPPVARPEWPAPQSSPRPAVLPARAEPVAVLTRHEPAWLGGSGWLFLGWCSGCVVLGMMVVRRAAKVWQLGRRAAEAPRELDIPLKVACSLLEFSPARVRLRISDEVGCPAICGFWRPIILVPRRLVGQLAEEQFQLVFAHELVHWKRWDLQINLLQTLLQIAYFYNPAVWIANANLRRLREEAVDDAVLIAFGGPRESYSNTLVDVAAQSLRPVELGLRLVGILESRKALAERIGRMASGPLPKSARLGPRGLAAVALVGVALLPMAGSPRAIAQRPAEKPVNQASAKSPAAVNEPENKPAPEPPLRGRITDEDGKPVTDATVQLVNVSNSVERETASGRDGDYRFDRVSFPGEHWISIYSDRCLGLTRSSGAPRLVVDPKKPVVQDFTLKIGCQVRVQAIDEEGHAVRGVELVKVWPSNPYQSATDQQGWMTIGGLTPGEHVFAFRSDGYILTRLLVNIEAPKTFLKRKLVLKRGVAVQGRALCSDGKPAAGWRVVALPRWWNFNALPLGELIKADGTFVLPQIGPGAYDIRIWSPRGGFVGDSTVLRNAELASHHGALLLHIDAPSPGSMVTIQGHLHFNGRRPKRSIRMGAVSSSRGEVANGDWHPLQRSNRFSLGPLPRGPYRVTFESPEIETNKIDVVAGEVNDLEVDIHVHGLILLRGSVSLPGARGPEPAREFLVRVVKLKPSRGKQPSKAWERVFSPLGQFSASVPEPAIYAVEATADGFLTARSEPVDSRHPPEKGIHIQLSKGATVAGTVVDEEGGPIDGAIVMSREKAGGELPEAAEDILDVIGVRTVAGRFQFEGLTPGRDALEVAHPGYALATLRNVEVRLQGQEPLRIVMTRGGTVCGHVQDERGRLMAGLALEFRRDPSYAGRRFWRPLAKALTDANGYYEVHHLPDELIHIRPDRGGDSLSVFHQAVLPVSGKTRTVDFGAGSSISGRFFLNRAPLVSTKLQLADDDGYGSEFGAGTTTDPTGAFVFTGIPPGKYRLSFSAGKLGPFQVDDWVPARMLEVNTAAHNFGRIEYRTGNVTVKVAGRPEDDAAVDLFFYDPSLFQVRIASRTRRHAKGSPFAFANVGPGKYDIAVGLDKEARKMRQMLVISPDDLNPMVTVARPKGTASIRGTLDRSLRDMMRRGNLELFSRDVRWSSPVPIDADGHFNLCEIPAGEYTLIEPGFRSGSPIPVILKQFQLADGQTKQLDITRDAIPASELSKQVLAVSLFTPRGVPLPGCRVQLIGPSGELKPTRWQGAHIWFAAPPGTYRLSASFSGAETLAQTVELKPPLKNGQQQDQSVNLTLAPVE